MGDKFHIKLLKKHVKRLEDLLDVEMLANERLAEKVKRLEQHVECLLPKEGVKTHKINAHSSQKAMRDLMELSEENINLRRKTKSLEQENKELKEKLKQVEHLKQESASKDPVEVNSQVLRACRCP